MSLHVKMILCTNLKFAFHRRLRTPHRLCAREKYTEWKYFPFYISSQKISSFSRTFKVAGIEGSRRSKAEMRLDPRRIVNSLLDGHNGFASIAVCYTNQSGCFQSLRLGFRQNQTDGLSGVADFAGTENFFRFIAIESIGLHEEIARFDVFSIQITYNSFCFLFGHKTIDETDRG